MFVSGPQRLQANAPATPRRRTGTAAAFELPGGETRTGEARGATDTAKAGGVVSVDALLTLQGTGDATERRQRALRQGTDLLDILDRLKLDLLSGRIEAGRLKGLLDILDQGRDLVDDAGLQSLLDDIDLRARVELAKHRHLL